MREARNGAPAPMGQSYEDPPPIPSDVEDEGDWADQKAWTEDAAAAHRAALDTAGDYQTMLSAWRPSSQDNYLAEELDPPAEGVKLTPQAKARAIKAYAESGMKTVAAAAAGVCVQTLQNHLRDDERFDRFFNEARLEYATRLQLGLHQRGFVGRPKPIIGRVGKDQDGVIGYELVQSDTIALAMAKAFLPDLYVERLQVDANVTGGVLVVGAPLTPEAWLAKHGGQQPLQTIPLLESLRKELASDLPPR